MEHLPPRCPSTEYSDDEMMKSQEDSKTEYDAHVMAKMFGKSQQEWLEQMQKGYGVKRMNLTDGVCNLTFLFLNNGITN